ncbi:hypothetical protein JVU11DRAFT_8209 [Chiua virens]|nr:hypothetical protein JVU11DRAFT_8209 [Chiua virens]
MSRFPVLQPYISEGLFPIMLTVFHGEATSPDRSITDNRSGDLYMSHSDIWIFQDHDWIKWVPTRALKVTIDDDTVYAAPCATQGLQIVSSESDFHSSIHTARDALGLGDTDDMIEQLMKKLRAVVGLEIKKVRYNTSTRHATSNAPGKKPAASVCTMRYARTSKKLTTAWKSTLQRPDNATQKPLDTVDTQTTGDAQSNALRRYTARQRARPTPDTMVTSEPASKGEASERSKEKKADKGKHTGRVGTEVEVVPKTKNVPSRKTDKGKRKAVEDDTESKATAMNTDEVTDKAIKEEPLESTTADALSVVDIRDSKRRRTTPIMQSLLTGISCPKNTKTVDWLHLGVTTYVPWFSKWDSDAVNILSGVRRAQDEKYNTGRPMVVECTYDGSDTQALVKMNREIEEALSNGSAVLVRGWEPTPTLEFTVESIGMYRPSLHQDVDIQNAVLREKEARKGDKGDGTNVHESMTIKRFIELADDPKKCLNLLDLPNIQPDVPIFVRTISDNVSARSATMNATHLAKTGENKSKKYFGVQTISGDSERVRGWDIMTHGGFLTHAHVDTCGLCTYITVRSGSKIWIYADADKDDKVTTRKGLFARWDRLLVFREGQCAPDGFTLGGVLLQRGDTLIQPPGVKHIVYTPQNGLMTGGHFLSYSTMHMTQLAMEYESSAVPSHPKSERAQYTTNATHPSIYRYVTWMILGLPTLAQDTSRTFYRRPILALVAIYEKEEKHTTKEAQDTSPWMSEKDSMVQEMEEERKAAGAIVTKLKTGLKITDAMSELEVGVDNLYDPGPTCRLATLLRGFA